MKLSETVPPKFWELSFRKQIKAIFLAVIIALPLMLLPDEELLWLLPDEETFNPDKTNTED